MSFWFDNADDFFEDCFEVCPPALERAPGTFSQHQNRGRRYSVVRPLRNLSALRISFVILITSINNLLCSPNNPSRFPAMLKFVHGDEFVIISTGGISAPLTFDTSPS
jgi:hypothetical protein